MASQEEGEIEIDMRGGDEDHRCHVSGGALFSKSPVLIHDRESQFILLKPYSLSHNEYHVEYLLQPTDNKLLESSVRKITDISHTHRPAIFGPEMLSDDLLAGCYPILELLFLGVLVLKVVYVVGTIIQSAGPRRLTEIKHMNQQLS
jgi:hypothetical protein